MKTVVNLSHLILALLGCAFPGYAGRILDGRLVYSPNDLTDASYLVGRHGQTGFAFVGLGNEDEVRCGPIDMFGCGFGSRYVAQSTLIGNELATGSTLTR